MAAEVTKGEHVSIEFEEVFLNDPGSTLAPSEAQRQTTDWVATYERGSASVDTILQDFEWGTYGGKPACLVKLSILSHARPRILTFVSATISQVRRDAAGASIPVTLSLAAWRPDKESGRPSTTTSTTTRLFAPQAQFTGGGFSAGSYSNEMPRPVEAYWTFAGAGYQRPSGVQFSLKENSLLQDGVPHHVHAAALFTHHSKEFIMDFNAEGKTRNWPGDVIATLKKKKVDRSDKTGESHQRVFRPPTDPPAKEFSMADLEEWTNTSPHLTQLPLPQQRQQRQQPTAPST